MQTVTASVASLQAPFQTN